MLVFSGRAGYGPSGQEERAVEKKTYALGVDLEKRQRGWVSSGEEGTGGEGPAWGVVTHLPT